MQEQTSQISFECSAVQLFHSNVWCVYSDDNVDCTREQVVGCAKSVFWVVVFFPIMEQEDVPSCEGDISDERLRVSHGHCSHFLFIFLEHRISSLSMAGTYGQAALSLSLSGNPKENGPAWGRVQAPSPNIPFIDGPFEM